jgi:AcrR family transcriptional regulator
MASRRDHRRQQTFGDIKDTARRQLANAGAAGISMRAIARHLAMTASAVHYYFPSHQALLNALIVDGFTSLAETLRTTYEGVGPRRPGERWLAVCRAHRALAPGHQAEDLLLYGHDGACAVKQRNPQVDQAFSRVVNVLFSIMRGALAADEIDTERIEAATPPSLRRQLATWRDENDGLGGPDGVDSCAHLGARWRWGHGRGAGQRAQLPQRGTTSSSQQSSGKGGDQRVAAGPRADQAGFRVGNGVIAALSCGAAAAAQRHA